MKNYQYIIIGGGMTGSAAAMEIRKLDPDGTIAIFSKEPYPPYNRPPLTKGLWDGKKIEDIIRPMDKYGVDLFLDDPILSISRKNKTVIDKNTEQYKFKKLLIATGGHPIQLPDSPEGVIFFRTQADYHKLRELTNSKQNFCVIGGGFIGSEIAAALNKNGKQVTMIFPEAGISGARFPDDLAKFINNFYQEKGISVLNGMLVNSISIENDQYCVRYQRSDGNELAEQIFDAVIVGIGIKPNVTLAQEAGLEIEDGIAVNEYLQTTDPDIFAAGDVAYFRHLPMQEHMRVEHEDNANKMGAAAGRNMTGDLQKYDHFPFFYSDLFDLGYEALGDLNKDYEIVEDWIDPFKKGTIYYLRESKIRGIVFWNLWGMVDKGRDLIQQGENYHKSELPGLFSNE